jgi:Mg2+ and Co2+ transporter CorA
MARKPGDVVNLRLRLPEALRRRLAHEADASNRSLNSEILWRLGQTFDEKWQQFIAGMEQIERDQREFTDRLMQNPEFREKMTEIIANMRKKED